MKKKEINDFYIQKIEHYRDNDFMLFVKLVDRKLNAGKAGQFVNILVPDAPTTFLRRPISICDVNSETDTMLLYVKQVGDGTRKLARMQEGDILNMVYPLGNGFTIENVQHPLLIGGGTGIAPMVYLCKTFYRKNITPHVLLGARSASALSLKALFKDIAHLHISTDDGSEGEKGVVTQHSLFHNLNTFDRLYTCGPLAMMKAVAKKASQASIPCDVSLENVMACGIGACLCCVTPTTTGNRCVCTDGPVFVSTELIDF